MPDRDISKIQLDFPLLNADLIRQLRLTGVLGVLDFNPVVQPVFIIGDRGISIETEQPVFEDAGIFSASAVNPAAAAVIVDTGQLAAGIHDIMVHASAGLTATVGNRISFEWRNAANAATLADWQVVASVNSTMIWRYSFALNILQNERLRMIVVTGLTGVVACNIMTRRRLVP